MKFVICLVMLFVAMNVMGAPFPYQSESEYQAAIKSESKIAQFDFDSTLASGSAVVLGTLPAKAIVTRSWIQLSEDALPATAKVSLGCKSAVDLMAATTLASASADAIFTGAVTAPASFVQTTTGCNVSATGSVANLTAGAFTAFIEYVFGK